MDIASLKNKRVGILGYGREGQSVARYLNRHGIAPVLFDKNPIEDSMYKSFTGSDYLEKLGEVEILFRSPGMWRLDPHLLEFEKNGGAISSQTIFFFDNCPAQIIGVTGTKGKGTTTTLSYEIAKTGGKNCFLTGNIGTNDPLDFLDNLVRTDLVFFELSSFQLQDLQKSPHISVVLMVTADHLDQHNSLEEYHESKSAITKFQTEADFAIINKDFPASLHIGKAGKGKKLWFSNSKVSFGIVIAGDKLEARGLSEFGVKDGPLLSLSELTLRGTHNLQNVAAALLVGILERVELGSMLETAKKFAGLEHRLELVAEKNGMKFYNDSYSTTPDTAIAAVQSFSEPLYIILGGSEKNLDYTGLGRTLAAAKNIAGIFLIGETAPRMEKTFREARVPREKVFTSSKTLEEIFERLKFIAGDKDGSGQGNRSVVLLSPATASFDMFKNYKERGNKFKELTNSW